MNFEEDVDEYDVAHWVTIKVRVTAPDSVTVTELREALFQKAVVQLRLASEFVADKTAQELLDAAQKAHVEWERLQDLSLSPSP